MKQVVAATFLLSLAPSLLAETLSQPLFRIDIDDGWSHTIEEGAHTQGDWGDLVNVQHPGRSGVLKIRSFRAPASVNPGKLREMTNVDYSEQLAWESWGDFSGYQYRYAEAGSFFHQWWLTDEKTIVFFVYSAEVEPNQAEENEIKTIVRSLRAN